MTVTPTQTNPWGAAFGCDMSIISWLALGNAEAGLPILGVGWSDRSIAFEGTFGGATVVLEGSNDGTNYHTLSSPDGVAISYTAATLKEVLEICAYIRPRTSGGAGTSINAYLVAVRH